MLETAPGDYSSHLVPTLRGQIKLLRSAPKGQQHQPTLLPPLLTDQQHLDQQVVHLGRPEHAHQLDLLHQLPRYRLQTVGTQRGVSQTRSVTSWMLAGGSCYTTAIRFNNLIVEPVRLH